jgi:endonuclease/exonuclease/phosphatase family metal-dependent hydrolase
MLILFAKELRRNLMFKKYSMAIVTLVIIAFSFAACGTSKSLEPDSNTSQIIPPVDDDVVQIMTWNMREFPQNGVATTNMLSSIIPDMAVDIIAVQEVQDVDSFNDFGDRLNDYSTITAYPYSPTDYYNPVVGYIYNHNTVTINSRYKIFQNENRMFPRVPYIIDVTWKGNNLVLINLHLKASGDNYIDYNDYWDEEVRRKDALDAIDNYIQDNLDGRNVIVLGDFNDEVQEPVSTNVFTSFINNADYVIADYEMTNNVEDYSYPGWPSHLDHIIINSNLFDEFDSEKSNCFTVKIDNNISSYASLISDHRPVLIKLDF